jgi:hypothetical protein
MRIHLGGPWAAVAVIACAVLTATAGPVAAQGFFQQLFGSIPPPPAPMPQPSARPFVMPYSNYSTRRPSQDDDDERASSGGKFKTVCVRMCDGFYFPISNSTSKKGFYRDQMRCRSACGDDARLFHLPAGATDIGDANDNNGRVYNLLPVAYRYRKALTPGCQCRQAPWSEAEQARHQQYAIKDADKQAQQKADNVARAEADKTIGEKAEAGEATEPAPVSVADAKGKAQKISANQKAGGARSATQQSGQPAGQQAGRRPQATPAATLAAAAPKVAQQPAPMGLGLGGGGYSWPGDPPRR